MFIFNRHFIAIVMSTVMGVSSSTPYVVMANEEPTPSANNPSPSDSEEIKKSRARRQANRAPASFTDKYDEAAEQAEKTAKAEKITLPLYVMLAVVCTQACWAEASILGDIVTIGTLRASCQYGGLGLTAADIGLSLALGASAESAMGKMGGVAMSALPLLLAEKSGEKLAETAAKGGTEGASKGTEAADAVADAGAEATTKGGTEGASKGTETATDTVADAGVDAATKGGTEGASKGTETAADTVADAGADTATEGAKNTTGEAGKETANKAAEDAFDVSSCISLASTLLAITQKTVSIKNANQTAKENKDLAKTFQAKEKRKKTLSPQLKLAAPGKKKIGGASSAVTMGSTPIEEKETSELASCSSAQGSGDVGGFTACARAFGGPVPNMNFEDPVIGDAFEKITGLTPGEFLQASSQFDGEPGDLLANTLGGRPGFAPASQIKAVTDTLENEVVAYNKSLGSTQGNAVYQGGRSKRRSKKKADPFESQMSNLLKKLAGTDTPEKKKKLLGVSEMKFGFANRTPAQIVEDPSISLFDRISYRYQQTKPRLKSETWKSPYNRATTGQN